MFSNLVKNFITFEESKLWHSRLIKNIPQDLKNKFILESQISPRKLININDECVCYYKDSVKKVTKFLKKSDKTLVYIDGPYSGPLKNVNLKGKPAEISKDKLNYNLTNYDILLLKENKIYPDIIIIDGRRPTLKLVSKNFSDYFKFIKSDYPIERDMGFNFKPPLYHSIFVKKGVFSNKLIKELKINSS